MYDYINGLCTYKTTNQKGCFATLEVGGIGYNFEIMPRDYSLLNVENTEIKFYTVLLHKEDKMSICGFLKREDRDMFNILTSVSGVGSKMALTLLNSFLISELVGFVLDEDYKSLIKAKGVGQKLAQKIILELKDKLNSYKNLDISLPKSSSILPEGQNIEDAQMVLMSLGYNNSEIKSALEKALSAMSKDAPAEDILKKSLQILSV